MPSLSARILYFSKFFGGKVFHLNNPYRGLKWQKKNTKQQLCSPRFLRLNLCFDSKWATSCLYLCKDIFCHLHHRLSCLIRAWSIGDIQQAVWKKEKKKKYKLCKLTSALEFKYCSLKRWLCWFVAETRIW